MDYRKEIDQTFLFITLLLSAFGLVMIFSSTFYLSLFGFENEFHYMFKHGIRLLLALALMFLVSRIKYKIWFKLAPLLLLISIILLIITLFMGKTSLGARRWISIGGFTLQPSEFARVALILYLSRYMSKKNGNLNSFSSDLLPPLLVSSIVLLLIFLEPNLGTAAIISVIVLIMFFIGGARPSHLIFIIFLTFVVFFIFVLIFPHARSRMTSFMHGGNYQVKQAKIAIGSGGLFGVGLGESKQKFFYLPKAHTDFIFAIIAEELGFIGVLALFILFLMYTFRGIKISLDTEELFSRYLGFGLAITPFIYFMVNVSVVLGLLPTTGIPLPFISFGGSSLLSNMIGTGIILNISKERFGGAYERIYNYRRNWGAYSPGYSFERFYERTGS